MSDPAPPPPVPAPYPLPLADFRLLFPAFATEPDDPTAQKWLDMGYYMVSCVWGPMQGFGQGLWAAHEMAKMAQAAQPGNTAGLGGIINSKAVGAVSVGYDTGIGTVDGAGSYNLTMYGRQYYQLARIFGMGPYWIGPPDYPPPMSAPWQGPIPYLIGRDW